MSSATPAAQQLQGGDDDDVQAVAQGGAVSIATLGLAPAVVESLSANLGISSLFSMQAAVVSHLTGAPDRDVVLCAPTGSGKTLAYALPILSSLASRVVPRLRAVIVVPTRDLAAQVHRVFTALVSAGPGTPGPDISVAVAVGASSVRREAPAVCAAEILIATPGRLVEHTNKTPGFSLQAVTFLVLDESDRLLQESYYGWADVVVPACGRREVCGTSSPACLQIPTGLAAIAIHPVAAGSGAGFARATRRRPRIFLASATQTRNPKRLALLDLQRPVHFVTNNNKDTVGRGGSDEEPSGAGEKLAKRSVTSKAATLQADLTIEDKYHVPDSLVERAFVVNNPRDKPFALAKLLGLLQPSEAAVRLVQTEAAQAAQEACTANGDEGNDAKPRGNSVLESLPAGGSTLVFTKSVEAAHRLARLLELFVAHSRTHMTVLEISGDLPAERRAYVVAAVGASVNSESAKKTVVVCSDVLARGMDISSVDVVINYDAPVHVNTYLHRVGRTARAGRAGLSITLLVAKEARHCKAMVRSINRGSATMKFRSLIWADEHFEAILPSVDAALRALKRVLRREQLGLIATDNCLPEHSTAELSRSISMAAYDDAKARALKRRRMEVSAAPLSRWTRDQRCVGEGANKNEPLGNVDVDITGADNDDSDDDDFFELLRAQVARNFLSRREPAD
jgi:ATP-dependent RNA helicase DDX51/DBP6